MGGKLPSKARTARWRASWRSSGCASTPTARSSRHAASPATAISRPRSAGRLVIEPLRIASLDITLGPDTGKPPSAPLLPFGMRLGQLDLARLHRAPGQGGRTWRATCASRTSRSTCRRAISAEGSFELEYEGVPVAATLTLGGTLDELNAHLKGTARGIPADVRAVLTPRKPQKITSLDARAGPVDLASLNAELPHAALDVQAKVTGNAKGFAGSLEAVDKTAGPIDRQRLPIASVQTRFAHGPGDGDPRKAAHRARRRRHAGGPWRSRPRGLRWHGEGEPPEPARAALGPARDRALRAARAFARSRRQTVRGTLSQAGMTVTAEACARATRSTSAACARRPRAARSAVAASSVSASRSPSRRSSRSRISIPPRSATIPRGTISGTVGGQRRVRQGNPRASIEWSLADSNLFEQPFAHAGKARVAGKRVLQADAEATGSPRLAPRCAAASARAGDRLAWTLEAPEHRGPRRKR